MGLGRHLRDPGAITVGALSAGAAWAVGVRPVAAGALGLSVIAVKGVAGLVIAGGGEVTAVPVAKSLVAVAPTEVTGGSDGHVFRREGEFWRIGSGEAVFSLRDAKGLRYLHLLISHPGREFHALHLAQEAEQLSAVPPPRGGLPEGTFLAGDDSLPVLDERAKAEYRELMAYLEAEVEEAKALNDEGRAHRAELDLDALKQEMVRATGLGGRDRKTGGQAERARINVTRAIHAAIDRIAEHDASLGHHLSASVHTGKFCRYDPDPVRPPAWRL